MPTKTAKIVKKGPKKAKAPSSSVKSVKVKQSTQVRDDQAIKPAKTTKTKKLISQIKSPSAKKTTASDSKKKAKASGKIIKARIEKGKSVAISVPITKEKKAIPSKKSSIEDKVEKKEVKRQKEHEKKWENLHKKAHDIKAIPFHISKPFPAKIPIRHPVFGWGWIISSKNHRLQVMFKDKTRMLLSNCNGFSPKDQ